ncbi:MAG: 3-mercaptopyruvate sulfurtransferase [Alphaproteobacteria bacterium]|nr:MAG: 3-mercaptopyruvate sulfurtransferase [Alphaproteobacteria bacterium]
MPNRDTSLIVSTQWLADHIDSPDIRIVDASWHLPAAGRDAKAEYQAEHIPGAVFFDIDDISDETSDLPHMLPRPEKFASRMRKLGLGDGNRIVVYDSNGLFSAARAWWMFQVMGHSDVAVLDGGLPKWKAEGRALSDMPPVPTERHFTARLNNLLVRDLDQIRSNIDSQCELVVDARAPGRFKGVDPEPREGMRSGHIPGAVNVPIGTLFQEDGTFRSLDELQQIFNDAGVSGDKPVVTSCGSGVTACIVYLALQMLGHQGLAVYDGSWSEWGMRDDTPIEV